MMAGPKDAMIALADAVKRELGQAPEAELEILSSSEALERFPQIRLDDSERLVYMPEGYTMVVPTCLDCLKWAADTAGVRREEGTVSSIDRAKKAITTDCGRTFKYSDLVLTAGPWTNNVLAAASLTGVPMMVSNEQTVELIPKPGGPSYDWDVFPLFTWSEAGYKGRGKDGGCRYFYTTPHVTIPSSGSAGVKIGFHRQGALLDNQEFQITEQGHAMISKLPHIRKDTHSKQQYEFDEFVWQNVQEFVRDKMPGLEPGKCEGFMRCLYQMTPDLRMIVGRHPQDESICFACGFSGSGFQFAPAVADYLVTLMTGSENRRTSASSQDVAARASMHQRMACDFDPRRFEARTS
jgi:glycine/D-amino acid oxidase-like deaminating enzyme